MPCSTPGDPPAIRAACRPVCHALAARLEAVQAHRRVVEERGEDADGVRAAADAGGHGVRQRAGELEHLPAGLVADHPLEVAHHGRERVRPGDRAQQVVGAVDVGDPVAHRLVDRVLEGPAARGHGDDLGAQQPHPGHVERLPAGVLLAHVHHALETEQGRGGGRGHAVLAGTGLGDHPGLAHPPGQQGLAQHVVDLVRAGVVQVLALEQDPGPTRVLGQPGGLGEDARPAGVGALQVVQLGRERRVGLGRAVGGVQLVERGRRAPRGRTGRRTGRSARWRPAARSRSLARSGRAAAPGARRP